MTVQKPPPGTNLDGGNPSTSGLIAFWPMWEGSGTELEDIVNAGAKFDLTGHSWTTGRDGIEPAVYLANSGGEGVGSGYTSGFMDTVASFSVMVWYKATTSTGTAARLLERGANDDWAMNFGDGSLVVFQDSVNVIGRSATTDTSDNAWHSTAVTWEDNVALILYTDGSAEGTPPAVGPRTSPDGKNLFLNRFGGGGFRADATYLCAGIWDRALSGAEITTLAADPFTLFEAAAGVTLVERRLIRGELRGVLRGVL